MAAVIEDGGRIFATQRGYGEFKDMWEFPGGKVEAGESREEALRREIREDQYREAALYGGVRLSGISPDDALLPVQCGVRDSGA